jgi:hypothetical protein
VTRTWLAAIVLLTAAAMPSDGSSDVPRSMLPNGAPLEHARGAGFSTHWDRSVPHCSWQFWYLQHSKKVWFRINEPAVAGLQPVFTYDGRPILHRSQIDAVRVRSHYSGRSPVVWGDFPGVGLGQGPGGSQMYLELWTRWTWLHPEACGHPERFGVDFFRPGRTRTEPG